MAPSDQFPAVFARLRAIMHAYVDGLNLATDEPNKYVLLGPAVPGFKRDELFGMIEIKKNYVSYHLFPVYMFPALLDDVSPALRQRMQGKSCFNFSKIDDALFAELAALTARGSDQFRQVHPLSDS